MGQLQDAGNTTTLAHYLNLLDTAGLLAGLEKFSANVIRKRGSSPKFQVYNTALISAQRPERITDTLSDPAAWGRMVESAVGAHLLNHALRKDFQLHYWRERSDEVDFVLQKGKHCIALEVKSNARSSGKGMQAFSDRFTPDRVLLIGEDGIPLEQFLRIDPMDLF